METELPEVVVVGSGFAGLKAAQTLREAPVHLTVVDRRNHHLFQPLLYQVATAALDPSDIAMPIRSILRGRNTDVVMADVVGVDLEGRRLKLTDDELSYDYLVLATGAQDAYFGHPEWARHAPGLKSLEDAVEVRRRVFLAFEEAERAREAQLRKEWLTFVLIGGGPTGVEMAGALAEISHNALKRDFHHINPSDARIVLVEGHPKLLPFYPDALTDNARRTLQNLGVEVRLGVRVTDIDARGVNLGPERVSARTILWSAGVTASPLGAALGAPVDRAGRVKVTPQLTVPGHEEIFVAGDLAYFEQDGALIPGVAPAAMQMGAHAAENIQRKLRGQPCLPFRYRDRGTFAVIGRGAAVGEPFKRFHLTGFLAWLGWLTIHLFFLIGFRNRISVMAKWAYAYVTMRRYARIITAPRPPPQVKDHLPAPGSGLPEPGRKPTVSMRVPSPAVPVSGPAGRKPG